MERNYYSLPKLTEKEEVLEVLKNGTYEEIMILPLSLGEFFPDWKFAQNTCLKLAEHEDPAIRANAILGIAYIARNKRILEKKLVKPVILRELKENTDYQWRIQDAIDDIAIFLKWKIVNV
ncbi:hypothetical protein D8Y16_14210 [Listeria seeligeri]|uniref:hypothetical protein n=2 Tax=Listeria seeligeri TaxID=1640 RepID=UPI0019448E76|nr:hypothetical protein [Listeria seeligeri]MBM5598270.1 hypothetical protein [Listeria seeligeri]